MIIELEFASEKTNPWTIKHLYDLCAFMFKYLLNDDMSILSFLHPQVFLFSKIKSEN